MNTFNEDITLLIGYLERLQKGKDLTMEEYVALKFLLSQFYESVDITIQGMDTLKEYKLYH